MITKLSVTLLGFQVAKIGIRRQIKKLSPIHVKHVATPFPERCFLCNLRPSCWHINNHKEFKAYLKEIKGYLIEHRDHIPYSPWWKF
jgi:hypothetical protein